MYQLERSAFDSPALQLEIASLLPDNATILEYDILAVAKRNDLIPFPLQDLLDPAKSAVELLPFLAWQYSIDLWDDAWSVETKRNIIQKWHYLHSLKGTAAGIREHVRFTGTTLKKVTAPPVRAFATRTYTQAERDAWLAVMPQFRLYRFKTNSIGNGKVFLGSPRLNASKHRAFCGREVKTGWRYRTCPPLTDASNRIGTQAYLYDNGQLEKVTTISVSKTSEAFASIDTYQIAKKGNGGYAIFPGHRPIRSLNKKSILGAAQQKGGLYTLALDGSYTYNVSSLHSSTINPGLAPVDTRFKYVQQAGTATRAECFPKASPKRVNNMCLFKRYLPESTARDRLYQQLYLFDPTRGVGLRSSRTFLGNLRLGIADFTAELDILVKGKRLRTSANDFVRGYLHKSPRTDLDAALRAVRIAKAARDTTLVRIGLQQVPTLVTGLPLDTDYHFGDRLLGA